MAIPTEPIGSIPRPPALIDAVPANGGNTDDPALEPLFDAAIRDTVARFEATGSPVVSDGEQRPAVLLDMNRVVSGKIRLDVQEIVVGPTSSATCARSRRARAAGRQRWR
jgi:hypothetical protein